MIKVIAEIGINHESSEEIAKKLIDSAYSSGCWAIKFQFRSNKGFYNSTNEIGDEIIYEQLKKNYLSLSKIKKLTSYAHKQNLKVGISFFTVKDFKKILDSNIKFDFYKIPSAEFSNSELVKKAKATKKLLMLSTGGHNLVDIKKNLKNYNFNKHTVIFHCTSNYPSEIGSQNLSTIKELKKIKNIKVGYSSHDNDFEVVFFAAALGAQFIERHITLDKSGDGLDDSSSSELEEFIRINKLLGNYKKILGDFNKPINQGEIINLQNLGTSLYAKRKFKKGDHVNPDDFEVKAPRKGLTRDEISKFINKPLIRELDSNESITRSHFVKNYNLTTNDFEFMNSHKISIPIRFHDMENIFNEFQIKNFEFHLSYEDIKNIKFKSISNKKKIFENKVFSYHLPDYINSYQLFDPLSKNNKIKSESIKIIDSVIKLAKISSDTSTPPIFVSSLSQNNFTDKDKYYKNLKNFINRVYEESNIVYLPQWLPKKAWYFGGAYDINLFSSYEDIEFIKKYKINICLDVAHLIMAANSAKANWKIWHKELIPYTKHYHLSDSYGTDGEGVKFGKGDLGNPKKIVSSENVKVLEVWQGHLNQHEGFKTAVKDLRK